MKVDHEAETFSPVLSIMDCADKEDMEFRQGRNNAFTFLGMTRELNLPEITQKALQVFDGYEKYSMIATSCQHFVHELSKELGVCEVYLVRPEASEVLNEPHWIPAMALYTAYAVSLGVGPVSLSGAVLVLAGGLASKALYNRYTKSNRKQPEADSDLPGPESGFWTRMLTDNPQDAD
jgi:hypothetical protein